MRQFLLVPSIFILSNDKKNIIIFHQKIVNCTAIKISELTFCYL